MKNYRIGIDAGGTKVAYGLVDEDNRLVDRFQHPTPIEANGFDFSDLVIENIEKLLDRNGKTKKELQGIGICMPSFILFDKGYICMTSAMVNIREFPMRDYLTKRLGVPIALDNDCNVAALAEHRFGAGRGSRHMIYVATSTGIGSGLILNGQLFRGSYGWAGESGHMLITPDEGILCGCQNQGCFMSWAAGRYIPDHIRQRARDRDTTISIDQNLGCEELARSCREGDPLGLEILDQMAHYIAVCIFNIYQLLNVNLFVFGGGMVNFGPMLFDRVRSKFDQYNHIPQPVEFRFAQLEKDPGIIGAAELVREAL
ncbi:MAG: ROK family protein [Clostridiales bacterium]|nr:ROK family protein [Clostridiales bacterium]